MAIVFRINRKRIAVPETKAGELLLPFLRNRLGLTGAKNGCSTGHCGTCTVLIDGKPKRSCLTRLSSLNGKEIITIEGLAEKGRLHPVQRAFLDIGAIQCGFCTPGMILTVVAFLRENPSPSREEIERALDRNICRCTGYVKIIEAVELASLYMLSPQLMQGDNRTDAKHKLLKKTGSLESIIIEQEKDSVVELPSEVDTIGVSHWDTDGIAKATGKLQFCDDLQPEGALHGAFVFAGVPHGRIDRIDYSNAVKMPGVHCVVTAKDVPALNGFGILKQDQPVFCDKECNFAYDILALVLADTEEHARVAAAAVEKYITPLPAIFSAEEAIRKGSILKQLGTEFGDVNAAKSMPDTVVVSGHFSVPYQEHATLETLSAIAEWSDEKGVTITSTTQSIFEVRRVVAKVMGESEDRVVAKAQTIGGGFGKKADLYLESAAAVAAKASRRPVKITLNRVEDLNFSTKRHPYEMDYSLGISPDGMFRFFEAELVSDGGPYTNLSPRVIDQACLFSVGPYVMPAGRVHGVAAKTNNLPCGAYRGFGINQANFAMETLIDMAAEKLGMDPFVIREKNAFHVGDHTVSGEVLRNSVGIMETLRFCDETSKRVFAELSSQYPKGKKVLGMGVAAAFKNVGAGKGKVDDAGAIFTILPDGRIGLRVSGIDMGQGFRTAMLQIASEALAVPMHEIIEICSDTSRTFHHANAVGERQTLINGMAVREAARRLNEKLRFLTGTNEEKPLKHMDAPERMRFAGVGIEYHYASPKTYPLDDEEAKKTVPIDQYRNYPGYAYVTHTAFVEVDTETGKTKVLKVIAAHDCGRVINPHICEGQIEGSCSMGIGYALQEHFENKEGQYAGRSIGDLNLPKASETPEYELFLYENPNPDGPYGAKGLSEIAMVPITPAVTNAIYHACGVRIKTLPANPEMLLKGIKENNREK